MRKLIDEILNRVGDAKSAISNLLQVLGTLPIVSSQITSSNELSVSDIITRADMVVQMSGEIATQPIEKFLLVSTNRLQGLRDQIAGLGDSIRRFSDNIDTLNGWGGVERIDAGSVAFSRSGSHVNLRPMLDEINSFVDSVLEPYQAVAAILQPKSIGTFGAASKAITELAIKNSDILGQLEEQLKSFQARDSEIAARQEDIRTLEAESQRLAQEIEKARKTVEEYESRASAAAASIETSRQQAAALETEVKNYDDRFRGFSASLDEREKRLADGNESLLKLQNAIEESHRKTNELNAKAEAMLGGATVAGLSSEYATRATEVDGQLVWARRAYYASILFLMVSVLVALNLFSFWGLVGGLPQLPKFDPTVT